MGKERTSLPAASNKLELLETSMKGHSKTANTSPSKKEFQRVDSKVDQDPVDEVPVSKEHSFLQVPDFPEKKSEASTAELPLSKNEEKITSGWKWIWIFSLVVILVAFYISGSIKSSVPEKRVGPRVNFKKVTVESRLKDLEKQLGKSALNIHMLWTTPLSTFKPRNYKVLEAYLYHNPNAIINIYATELQASDFEQYTSNGYRINIVRLDDEFLTEMADHCPGKVWVDGIKKWKTGKFFYSHITDYIRFCALYRWGGLYTDFDAVTLQRMDQHENFIGRDTANSNGNCHWCAWKDDIYLPPGVMATKSGHLLPKKALEIGFEKDYNPDVFSAVGPMAVTKAYNKLGHGIIDVLEQHVMYPYNHKTSFETFRRDSKAQGTFDRLRRRSISLHLFGHETSNLEIEKGSVVDKAFQEFRIYNEKPNKDDMAYQLKVPTFIEVGRLIQNVEDVRIIPSGSLNAVASKFLLTLTAKHGLLRVAGKNATKELLWQKSIVISSSNIAEMNTELSKLIYYPKNLPNGRDSLSFVFSAEYPENKKSLITQRAEIPVYDIPSLVTIIVKTVGRISKVISLAESVRKYYTDTFILVSDDHEHLLRGEGMSREFYYLPLPADVGLSAGRNRMVERVKTEYFLTLDDDFTLDETSTIGALLHALETKPADGSANFDIAAGKNPVDEPKYNLDFCGFMTISDKTLFLKPGSYGEHAGCIHVDFVPNIFLGRTKVFQDKIKWDELLKVGEHEDFFLRAKALGIKTLTCPGVTFIHDQVEFWLKQDDYEVKRSRVFDFWKLSLRKHKLLKLNSFGKLMMDLVDYPPISTADYTNVLSNSIRLFWESDAPNFRILHTIKNKNNWSSVNRGSGEDYYGGNEMVVTGLIPGTTYTFRIYAGNRFSYEGTGYEIDATTLTLSTQNDKNLVRNPLFNNGMIDYTTSMGGLFHIVKNKERKGKFNGRVQILTKSYNSQTPTYVSFSQVIDYKKACLTKDCHDPENMGERNLIFQADSKVETLYTWTRWNMELKIWFEDDEPSLRNGDSFLSSGGMVLSAPHIHEKMLFDPQSPVWQTEVISVCLSPTANVKYVEVIGSLESYRGSVFFDNFVLIEN